MPFLDPPTHTPVPMKVKVETEKVGLKLNIQKTKIMASGPTTSWEILGKQWHGTMDWFQIGKGTRQGFILSPCLLNLHAEYIMRNAGLEEAQAGIKIARKNIRRGSQGASRAAPGKSGLHARGEGHPARGPRAWDLGCGLQDQDRPSW